MAGKKDQAVTAVISGLTNTQAADIVGDIIKAKNKHAPFARGTAVQANRLDIGKSLSSGLDAVKKLTSGDSSNGKKK